MSQIREHWSSKLGFIFAAIGSAIGLGVLWKFPYTVGNYGGGLFLLTYIFCIIVIGVPVMIGELILGRLSQRAAVGAFEVLSPHHPNWKITGWLGVISSFLIMSFYSIIAGWGMSYILMSLTGFYQKGFSSDLSAVFDNLAGSGSITVFWHFLFTLVTMMIVLSGVRKGIEYWSKIMTRALFVILLILFLLCTSMDGFHKAIQFIFSINTQTFDVTSVLEALGLAFFTLSLGQGIMISYGSYMSKEEHIPQLSFIVAISVVIVAILAALTIFTVTFSFGLPPQQGSGLIFKTLPYLFAKLPGAMVISTVFFILFVFTALTSAIPFIEVVATNIMELFGWSRQKAVLSTALSTFIFGIPSALASSKVFFPNWENIYGQDFLDTIDIFVSSWLIPIGGLLTALFIGWKLRKEKSLAEFTNNAGSSSVFHIWLFFVKWIVPITIFLIIVQKSNLFNI